MVLKSELGMEEICWWIEVKTGYKFLKKIDSFSNYKLKFIMWLLEKSNIENNFIEWYTR